MERLKLIERQSMPVDAGTLAKLRGGAGRSMLAAGVVRIVSSKSGELMVEAGSRVGFSQITTDLAIQISEKIPGSLEAFHSHLLSSEVKLVSAAGQAGAGATLEKVCELFVQELGLYLGRGMARSYHWEEHSGTLPKGRILVRATADQWARGRRPRIVSTRALMSSDNALNQLLRYCTLIAEAVLSAAGRTASLSCLRSYAQAFCTVRSIRADQLGDVFREGETIAIRRGEPTRRLLAIAQLVAGGMSAVFHEAAPTTSPHSVFADLSLAFERAVRVLVQKAVPAYCKPDQPVFLFGSGKYECKPDYILRAGSETLIGDAKYKEFKESPGHDDVYQLLAHMEAHAASAGFLISPTSGQRAFKELGISPAGRKIFVLGVRPLNLSDDVAWALAQLPGSWLPT